MVSEKVENAVTYKYVMLLCAFLDSRSISQFRRALVSVAGIVILFQAFLLFARALSSKHSVSYDRLIGSESKGESHDIIFDCFAVKGSY